MAQVPVSTLDEPILYPFIEVGNGYFKFPKHQLCRQNSTLAILAVDPSCVNVRVTRSTYDKLLKRTVRNQSPSLSPSDSQESIEITKLNSNVDQLFERNIIERYAAISSKRFVESSVTDIDPQSPSEMDDDKDMQLVGQNLLAISKGMDFLTCDVNNICLLLNNDKLGVSDESVVFRAAYRWLTFRPPTRLVYADQIMRCVRFGLMRPRDLLKCFVRCQKVGLMDSSEFCEQLFIGFLWSIAAKYDLTHLIDELKPKNRQSNESSDSDEPVFSSGFPSRVTLVSDQSSMTDFNFPINE